MEDLKIKIESLLHDNASDFEISKLLKEHIKEYFGTLEESFAHNNGKNFLLKHTRKIALFYKWHIVLPCVLCLALTCP